MHSKADNTFSCRAGRQRVSVPVLARGGRPAGRRSGLGHRPRRRAPDARRIPCRQAARVPRRLPAVTLIVILPAARPRYAHAARAQPPPALAPRPVPARPRAGAGGAGPHRRPGSAADHRPGNGRCRGAGPRRRPCSRRRGTQSCGLELRRVPHGPGAGPARTVREPRPCPAGPPIIAAFLRSPGAGPGKTFRPGRIRHGPSMYEMEGPCPASPPRLASCLVFAERRAPPAGARYPREGPVSRLLPRSRRRPRVVPVSSGESIITTAASTAQDPAASHFLFFRYPRKAPQRAGSYPHSTAVIHGLFTTYPQVPECQPENTTTAGAECPVLCNQLAT